MDKMDTDFEAVRLENPDATSPVLLICEHASNYFPPQFDGLGLSEEVQQSHVAWDPGAYEVMRRMGNILNAKMISGCVSRLVYDCNRPPEAKDAVPVRSEIYDVPGNKDLDVDQYMERVSLCYTPFHKQVSQAINWAKLEPVLVTIHSFTPIYFGSERETDIGILHDEDTRLADAMLAHGERISDLKIERNEPYGPEDGVTYTLQRHGIERGLLNVMIEVRNDLIQTATQQDEMAELLSDMLQRALSTLEELNAGEAS
ncbi:N-formylglutamate amidohydrolase [Maritalea mediterranea]|uniref:N-formylglutamate amidohydrolase n=1 Tax=Maritalea mediterranea TaxID=2909667 RepID=A0ABS9E8T7_9HYPH|nr:N-formylglutamate amidohydrolase [Maritalea mediterranea]MCF4099261.1 N-formylglutamate amidohydrolase [Maritalea mediterranea]